MPIPIMTMTKMMMCFSSRADNKINKKPSESMQIRCNAVECIIEVKKLSFIRLNAQLHTCSAYDRHVNRIHVISAVLFIIIVLPDVIVKYIIYNI